MLESAARAQEQLRLGTLLAEIGRELQLTDEEIALFHSLRDQSPARAACFSTLGNCPDSRVDKSPATPSLPHGYALRNSRRAAFQSGYSEVTTAQKRGEWFISSRCATSWAAT